MKTSKIIAVLAASLPIFSSAGTSAKQPVAPVEEVRRALTYDYIEGGYTGLIPSSGSGNHGGYFEASYSPVNNVFIFGRSAVMGGDDTLWDVALGLGLYVPLLQSDKAPTVDFVLRGGWNFSSFDNGDDTNGWFVAPGFRALITDSLELNAQAFYYNNEDGDDGIAAGAGMIYYFNKNLALTANYSYDFDDESHFVQSGVRYMW
jgi:hypothetical protein